MIGSINAYTPQTPGESPPAAVRATTPAHAGAAARHSGAIADKVHISDTATRFQSREKPQSPLAEKELNEDEKREVQELKKRDQEVKAHEQAHMAAGGGLVQGGASFTFQRGPDGKSYAVGGEVKIDTSPERDPDQTIRKMQQVKRAALAPAQPSGTDRSVAARAAQVETQARAEKAKSEEKNTQQTPGTVQGYPNANPAAGPQTNFQAPLGQHINITA